MHTVSAIIKKLLIQEPYYGLFACGLNKEWSEEISTAGVSLDGINYKLVINKQWWESIDNDMKYAVIHHELNHLVFYHVVDRKTYEAICPDKDLVNIAMD